MIHSSRTTRTHTHTQITPGSGASPMGSSGLPPPLDDVFPPQGMDSYKKKSTPTSLLPPPSTTRSPAPTRFLHHHLNTKLSPALPWQPPQRSSNNKNKNKRRPSHHRYDTPTKKKATQQSQRPTPPPEPPPTAKKSRRRTRRRRDESTRPRQTRDRDFFRPPGTTRTASSADEQTTPVLNPDGRRQISSLSFL